MHLYVFMYIYISLYACDSMYMCIYIEYIQKKAEPTAEELEALTAEVNYLSINKDR